MVLQAKAFQSLLTAGCSQPPPRAALACRDDRALVSSLPRLAAASLTHACFFTETGVSDTCYDVNCAVLLEFNLLGLVLLSSCNL